MRLWAPTNTTICRHGRRYNTKPRQNKWSCQWTKRKRSYGPSKYSLSKGKIVNIYLVTTTKVDGSRKSMYPFVPAYAITICKSQGQTLPNVIVWFNCMYVPADAAYVAVSRARKLDNLRFRTETVPWQYTPVKLDWTITSQHVLKAYKNIANKVFVTGY